MDSLSLVNFTFLKTVAEEAVTCLPSPAGKLVSQVISLFRAATPWPQVTTYNI
jgi:hypothetical protein